MSPARETGALLALDGGIALLAMACIWPAAVPAWMALVLCGALLGMLWGCGAYRDAPCELPARAGLAGGVIFTAGLWIRPELIAPFEWWITGIIATLGAVGVRYWWWQHWPRRLARIWCIHAPPPAEQRFMHALTQACPAARITDDPGTADSLISDSPPPIAPSATLTTAEVFERFWFKTPLARRGESWPEALPALPATHGVGYLSRGFGLLGLLVSLPVLGIAAAWVFILSPGPVLYRQTRIGLGGRSFVMLKLSTMQPGAEETGVLWSPPEDSRILPGSRWLRATHLDELPQLWNLVCGDMAIVGPRPERPEFVPELTQEIPCYDLRHHIPPGITGWAQVMHPYGSSVEDARRKCEYDLYYLKHRSWALDGLILFETALAVLGGRGR